MAGAIARTVRKPGRRSAAETGEGRLRSGSEGIRWLAGKNSACPTLPSWKQGRQTRGARGGQRTSLLAESRLDFEDKIVERGQVHRIAIERYGQRGQALLFSDMKELCLCDL